MKQQDTRHKTQDTRHKTQDTNGDYFPTRAFRLLLSAFCFLLAACTSNTALPTPDATAYLATRVAEALSAMPSAAPATLTVPASPTPTTPQTATPSQTATVTLTPSATLTPTETATITPTPRPTPLLSSFPLPPTNLGGVSHFYFGNPIGEGYSAFIGSAYRYGSIGPGQRFAPHHGVDFSSPEGAPLIAVAAGTIYYAGNDLEKQFGPQPDFYGNLVVIQLAQTWGAHVVYALYGHMDQVLVQTGQIVNQGDLLGTVGATGVALGPHPHLEARIDAPESYWDTRNPELWLYPGPGYGTLAVRVVNANQRYLPGVRVALLCGDGAARYMDTYWYNGVNPDNEYGENAAMMNLPAGYCNLEATILGTLVQERVYLTAGEVAFVELKGE